MTQQFAINLHSPDFKADPYPVFARVRSDDPVHLTEFPGNRQGWMITRYEEAEKVLRDPRFIKDQRHVLTPEQLQQLQQHYPVSDAPKQEQAFAFSNNMLGSDPPDHTRLRSLVSLSFTPRLIEQWRERIQAITNELLDAVQEKGKMDIVNDLAFPLPLMVITEMLGIPPEDSGKFRAWSNSVIEASGNPEAFQKRRGEVIEFREYLRFLINEKRKQLADDLMSLLIRNEEDGDKLSEGELIAMVFLLLVAGHETTVNLISNGALALMTHPEQMQALREHPELLKSAIEEFLRFHGPLMTATQRWAAEDVELAGKLIRKNDYVVIILASANHDPAAFHNPDDLDITRSSNPHLAFGKGIHYCLGAPLARLEGQVAIGTLLQRMPQLQLAVDAKELVWRPGALIMGLRSLPVTF
ncbi:MAG: cytochrome P450 [Ktedonobacteraceae bacterium]|nr:cytochrome P450 [Ktedonobacteraceae bacterium]